MSDLMAGMDFSKIRADNVKNKLSPMADARSIGCDYEVWSLLTLEQIEAGEDETGFLVVARVYPLSMVGNVRPSHVVWSGSGYVRALRHLVNIVASDERDNT